MEFEIHRQYLVALKTASIKLRTKYPRLSNELNDLLYQLIQYERKIEDEETTE